MTSVSVVRMVISKTWELKTETLGINRVSLSCSESGSKIKISIPSYDFVPISGKISSRMAKIDLLS